MKTGKERNTLESKTEAPGRKPAELSEDALGQVAGGVDIPPIGGDPASEYNVEWRVGPGENHNSEPINAGEYRAEISGENK